MTTGARQWAFAVSAACIGIVAAVLLVYTSRRGEGAPPHAPDRPVVLSYPPTSTAAAPAREPSGRGSDVKRARQRARTRSPQAQRRAPHLPPAARATSTAFVRAFLRYEAGAAFGTVRRAFTRNADDLLVRELRDAPPRAARGLGRPPRGSLARIGTAGRGPDGELLVTTTVVYGQRRSQLLLTLRPASNAWRVARFR